MRIKIVYNVGSESNDITIDDDPAESLAEITEIIDLQGWYIAKSAHNRIIAIPKEKIVGLTAML